MCIPKNIKINFYLVSFIFVIYLATSTFGVSLPKPKGGGNVLKNSIKFLYGIFSSLSSNLYKSQESLNSSKLASNSIIELSEVKPYYSKSFIITKTNN